MQEGRRWAWRGWWGWRWRWRWRRRWWWWWRRRRWWWAPDGCIYGLRPGKKVAFDVSVAHYSNLVLGSAQIFAQDGLTAAAEREKSKRRKFEAKLKQTGDDFVALVVETSGAVGKETRMLLKEVSELLEEKKRKDYRESASTQISAHFPEGTRSCGRRIRGEQDPLRLSTRFLLL